MGNHVLIGGIEPKIHRLVGKHQVGAKATARSLNDASVGRIVARHVQHRGRHQLRVAGGVGIIRVGIAAGNRGAHSGRRAGRQTVHANVVGSPLTSQVVHQPHHAHFCGAIIRLTKTAENA